MELKNNYIMGFHVYAQDLPGVMKLLNNYIAERGETETSRRHLEKNSCEYHLHRHKIRTEMKIRIQTVKENHIYFILVNKTTGK